MRTIALLLSLAASRTLAYPGMGQVMAEIKARDDYSLGGRSTIVFGDLTQGSLSPTGDAIKGILQGGPATSGDSSAYTPPGSLNSTACKNDPLCLWYYIAQEMSDDFADTSGCTDLARGAIRQGFHDAAAWKVGAPYGGADGSLLLSDELSRSENLGLQPIGDRTREYYDKYHPFGAGMADIIQTAAIVSVVSCPGGPKIRAFAGRKDESRAALPNLLPSPFQSAQELIDLFAAKTFTASDLVALVGAHTASKQFFVDPSRAGASQDSDPQIWDTTFYRETLKGDNKTIFIFPSDKALATYSSTKGQWNTFAGTGGQAQWGPAFAQAYFRMSMLGVNNMNDLTEITKVIPAPR
ncbi:peroxidase [Xylariaceae sp. FL1272]|nr:peroxidase [Xylariaceae sp. FL1272]